MKAPAASRQIQCAKVVDEDRLSNQSVACLLLAAF